jgi:hypothetical protein
MSETTNAPAEQSVQINLRDMANRYMSAIQRIFDLASSSIGSLRCQTEKDYEEFSRQARFMPSPESHLAFDRIRPVTESWMLRLLLNEAFNAIVPLLEDCRSVVALAQWKAAGSGDQMAVPKILGDDRNSFLRIGLVEKIQHLRDTFNLNVPNDGFIAPYIKLTQCLTRGGTVAEVDATEGKDLVVPLLVVQIDPAQGSQNASGRLVTIPKRFAAGQNVEFRKEEILNIFAAFSVFATGLLGSLQARVQELLPNEAGAPAA